MLRKYRFWAPAILGSSHAKGRIHDRQKIIWQYRLDSIIGRVSIAAFYSVHFDSDGWPAPDVHLASTMVWIDVAQ